MDHNPELEKAEAELQEQFRRQAKAGGPYAKWTDGVIFFAAVMHLLSAGFWLLMFLVAPFLAVHAGGANAWLVVWICSLPSAGVSLGIAFALERILGLASPTPPADPNDMPPMPVQ